MLTDLSFLEVGQVFPPKKERERLEMYDHNLKIFNNRHAEVYEEAFKRIKRVISNFEEVVSYEMIVNYQKLISLKVADLLVGEVPKVKAGELGSPEQICVDAILKNTLMQPKSHEVAIDASRFGDGLLYVYKDVDKGMVDASQPMNWFPIVDATNIKRIKQHVIAWIVELSEDEKQLHVQIHDKKGFEYRVYKVTGRVGGYTLDRLISTQRLITGLDDFAIVQFPNVLTSDRIHGMDDYSDIDSIVSELLVRVGQISKILDKHAEPSMTGPISALEQDPITKEWKVKAGTYFVSDGKDDKEPKYLTWDGHLDASFKLIEQLINFLHAISETGGQLLGDTNQEGGALSGTALRFKLISPLAKVKRIAMRFKPALEKAIILCSQLGGEGIIDLRKIPISITFMDGLPNDPLEESQIIANRTANGKTMSMQRAIEIYDNMTTADAENEVKRIVEEEASLNPIMPLDTPFNGNNDPNANPKNGGGE